MAYVGYWFRTVAIDVILSLSYFEFVLFSSYLPFPPSKPKSTGNFSILRRNEEAKFKLFFLLVTAHCLIAHRMFRR